MKLLLSLIFLLLIGCGAQQAQINSLGPETTVKETIPPVTTTTESPTTSTVVEVTTTIIPITVPSTTTTVKPVVTTPPSTSPPVTYQTSSFLECVKWRESRGDYTAVNPSSGAAGAYQFMEETSRNTALHAGREDLAYSPANTWSPADQDAMAQHLLVWQGPSPWASSSHPC